MINLDKLPGGGSWEDNKVYTQSTVAQVEVLSKNKVPFDGVSCERDGKYRCPTCREHSLALAIDYRCVTLHCNSRVIKYKIFDTEKTEAHAFYDIYIKRFYDDVERRKRIAKKVTRDVKSPEETNR